MPLLLFIVCFFNGLASILLKSLIFAYYLQNFLAFIFALPFRAGLSAILATAS